MLAPKGNLPLAVTRPKAKEWAHMVDVNKEITNFHELVPNMAKEVCRELLIKLTRKLSLCSGHLSWILFKRRLFII